MRAAAGIAIAILITLISGTGARAAGDPYIAGEQGYDISWPQCGDPPPAVGTFAIIGVNGGAPFSGNLCMTDQYAAAPRSAPPSLYLNTGYQDDYRYQVTSGSNEERQAWAIGCSEAETSVNYAYALGVSSISMWWLDVEILNRWSANLALNRFTLQGMVTRLIQSD